MQNSKKFDLINNYIFYLFKKLVYKKSLFIIFFVSLVPINWFNGYLIAGGDYFPEVNPEIYFNRIFYTWGENGLGSLPKGSSLILLEIVIFTLSKIGFSIEMIQIIFFIYLNFFAGFSMLYLTYSLYKNELMSVLSALFYMTNIWALISLWTVPYTFTFYYNFAYSFFPLLMTFLIKLLQEDKLKLKLIFLSTLTTLLMSPSYSNPTIFLLQMIILFYTFMYFLFVNKKGKPLLASLKFFTFIICLIFSNSYWLFPLFPLLSDFLKSPYRLYASDVDAFKAHSLSILNALRITGPNGYWTLRDKVYGDPIIPWSSLYFHPIFNILSFSIPMFSFLSIFFKSKDKFVHLFTSIAIFSIFMMVVPNLHFGLVIINLLETLSLLPLLRDPFHKFGSYLALAYSVLLGVFFSTALMRCLSFNYKRFYKNLKNIFSLFFLFIIIILLVTVYAYPYWTGDIIYKGGRVLPSARIKIPNYYFEAATWLNSMHEEFNILSLPLIKAGALSNYLWENGSHGYFGMEPGINIFPKPLLFSENDANGMVKYVVDLILNKDQNALRLLAFMNVKYILYHNDFHPILSQSYNIPSDPSILQIILNSLPDLELEKKYGNLYFYCNKLWKPNKIMIFNNLPIFIFNKNNSYSFNFYIPEKGEYKLIIYGKIGYDTNINDFYEFIHIDEKNLLEYGTKIFMYNESILIERIELEKGLHNLKINYYKENLIVLNGWDSPISWSSITGNYQARSFYDQGYRFKVVVRADGVFGNDSINFPLNSEPPYKIPENIWSVYNSTLIYIINNNSRFLYIDEIYLDDKPLKIYFDEKYYNYNLQCWWESGFMGRMGIEIKPSFPIIIPPYEKAIISISENWIPKNITLIKKFVDPSIIEICSINEGINYSTNFSENNFNYIKIDPTYYIVNVNASSSFFLVLNQLYNNNWKIYIDDINSSQENHFIYFEYTNVWKIEKTGHLLIKIVFYPQRVFFVSLFITCFFYIIIIIILINVHKKF